MSSTAEPADGTGGSVATSSRPLETIGLDADDTLWHSEVHFVAVEDRFREMLGSYDHDHDIDAHLLVVERHNLEFFGYGVKAFTLSMVETAIQLTDGAVSTDDIARIVGWGKEMMRHPIDLLDGVAETIERLRDDYRLLILTKGDLLHQEAKVAQSGLADLVEAVEVMTEKDVHSYRRVLDRHQVDPATFLMAGNSVKSDILPVLALGGHAAHLPYEVTWAHEEIHDGSPESHGYHVLASITELPTLAAALGGPTRSVT